MWPGLTKKGLIAGNTGVWLIICNSISVQGIKILQTSVKSPWISTWVMKICLHRGVGIMSTEKVITFQTPKYGQNLTGYKSLLVRPGHT